MVAGERRDDALRAKIVEIGSALKATYQAQTKNASSPPLDYAHPSVYISGSEQQQMNSDIANAAEVGLYAPSREDLRTWYKSALQAGNQALSEQIASIGQQLGKTYRSETEKPEVDPPLDYRSPFILVSSQDRQRIEQSLLQLQSHQAAIEP